MGGMPLPKNAGFGMTTAHTPPPQHLPVTAPQTLTIWSRPYNHTLYFRFLICIFSSFLLPVLLTSAPLLSLRTSRAPALLGFRVSLGGLRVRPNSIRTARNSSKINKLGENFQKSHFCSPCTDRASHQKPPSTFSYFYHSFLPSKASFSCNSNLSAHKQIWKKTFFSTTSPNWEENTKSVSEQPVDRTSFKKPASAAAEPSARCTLQPVISKSPFPIFHLHAVLHCST